MRGGAIGLSVLAWFGLAFLWETGVDTPPIALGLLAMSGLVVSEGWRWLRRPRRRLGW